MSVYIMATVQIPILHEYFKPEIPIYGRFLYEIRNDMNIREVIPLWIANAKQICIAVKPDVSRMAFINTFLQYN